MRDPLLAQARVPVASFRQQQLRRWYRLPLEIKQACYGVGRLLDLGSGDPGWLSSLQLAGATWPVAGVVSMAAQVVSRAGAPPPADETAAAA
ncbi:hypothetical protein [Aeromonas australiensis]|uniref:hypothetical protein n=1 Tax=Aeromonas australiensis TaxID=1114880 RepID=UPI001FCD0B23|nr:hypothetical protein [Aeromonas australiensis]